MILSAAIAAFAAAEPQAEPFSVERIRSALAQAPPEPAAHLETTPQFRVEVVERQRFIDLLPPMDFGGGPVPPGGLYAYEQMQRLGNMPAVPVISIDVLPIAHAIARAVRAARTAREQAAAQAEVRRAIAAFCAAQPDHGAGIQSCAISPAIP